MSKLHTFFKKITSEYSRLAVVILLAATLLPAAAFAWGPNRPTYSINAPADHVTMNSITDNPKIGDERNFMRVREQSARNETYADSIAVTPGKEYVVFVYYHNNASSTFNSDAHNKKGIARGAYMKSQIPAIVKNNTPTKATAYVGASNANPAEVYDDITFENKTGGDVEMRYVPGSTTIHNLGPTNGKILPDTILSGGGIKLGYDAIDGNLPGCNQYAGFVTYRVKAEQPNFTFKKEVRKNGTKEWKENITVNSGDKVDYLLTYKNTGTTDQNDVIMKDVLPKGITYVKGSAKLANSSYPSGTAIGDGIGEGGKNIGNYKATANAFLTFSATVTGTACETLTNTAALETKNGNIRDTASVQVNGTDCKPAPEALPTTGPVEVIAGLIGIGAITLGVIYFIRSRRELDAALIGAQSQDIVGRTTLVAHDEAHHAKEHTHKAHESHETHKPHSSKK